MNNYRNKNTASLTDDQQETLEQVCDASNKSKTEVFRFLIEQVGEAGGLSALTDAVEEHTSTVDSYDPHSYDGDTLPREWLTDEYERGTPLNPEHIDPDCLPKQSDDKAAVLHGISIYTDVDPFDEDDDGLIRLIWEYVGMTEYIESTYTDLVQKLEQIHGSGDREYHSARSRISDAVTDTVVRLYETNDGAVRRATRDILDSRGELSRIEE